MFFLQKYVFFIIVFFSLLIIYSCAKIGSPTGGAKDTYPPEVTRCVPPNRTVFFKEKNIGIYFNEYVQLKNIRGKIIISPPLEEIPEVKLKGKQVVIDLPEKIKDSATYTIRFGDAISDLTEGNILSRFSYVFSTKGFIDTMSFEGEIKNAFSGKPEQDVFVILYCHFNDSAPITIIPDYLAKTDGTGRFSIENIENRRYRIFALRDANNNLLFDLPNESIAFNDSVIIPVPKKSFADTIPPKDSLLSPDSVLTYQPVYQLFLFEEDHKKQYITKTLREQKYKCSLLFNRPLQSNPLIELLPPVSSVWIIQEISKDRDSVTCWITDSSVYARDSLIFRISYLKRDSAEKYYTVSDTILFRYSSPATRTKKKESQEKNDSLQIRTNITEGMTAELNSSLLLELSHPVLSYLPEKIRLSQLTDSLEMDVTFDIIKDSSTRNFTFHYELREKTKYRLRLFPGAFTDIYRNQNDSLNLTFSTRQADYYGNIHLRVKSVRENLIIHLLNEKEIIVREYFIESKPDPGHGEKILKMEFLPPGTYRIKCIEDKNKNKKWDTGRYIKHIQPERVLFYPEGVTVRSNWDMELEWGVNIE